MDMQTKPKYTPGPWQAVKSLSGFHIARIWTSGLYQRKRDQFETAEKAQAAADLANGRAS
jgi:hypothetical protein